MGYEPLHHKYRPQIFADLVGQEAIAHTLTNALNSKRIAPAYLFTGARGTGKTSSARIMAKSLNCLSSGSPTPHPCGKCELCHSIANGNALDITEIDAASNTGVDNIRELIERAQFAPVKARFKVYIIDECLTGDTLVQTDTGLMRIDNQDLLGKQVLSYNESLSTWEYKKVLRWLDRDVKPTLIIKTNQRSIQCTGNHLIRTESGWISASNVTIGMNILSPEPVDVEKGSKSLNSCFTKVDDYRVSCPTGSDIPTKKITASGNVVKKITLNLQDQSLLKYCDSFTGHYWEILPLPSQISTVASQELLGHEELKPITMFAWAQMPVESDYQSYRDILLPQWATNLERVESITVVGDEPVYDIEVEDNHNFVANGLLVHNCHMLSTAAFNALLKTLEEPPDRVTFILATTDPQRVLPTIISRCQRFDFRRIPLESMVKHLGKIATNENININTEALTLVAQIAQGGLRDAESLLDQLSLLDGEITVEAVWDLVGSVAEQDLLSLIEAIANDHSTQLIDYVRRIMDRGREPLIVLQNLANMYRDLLIAKTASDRSDLVAMTSSGWERLVQLAQTLPTPNILLGQQHLRSAELQIRNSTQPRLWLEVTLMGLLPSAQGGQSSNTFPAQATHPRNISATPLTISQSPKPNPIPQSSPVPKQELLTSVPDLISHSSIEQPVTKTSSELSIPISISLLNTQSPILSQNDDLNSFASVGYDLNQLWQNLLLMLPSPTRAIFVQMEACFLEVDTNSVKIGLGGKRDETTKNIAIQKRLELENACSQLLQRPIKVMFKFVASPSQSEQTQVQVPAPLSQSPAIATPTPNPSPSINLQVPSPNPVQPDTTSNLLGSSVNASVNRPELPMPTQTRGYVVLSEEERIARNMADFFNGQIIDLDEAGGEQDN